MFAPRILRRTAAALALALSLGGALPAAAQVANLVADRVQLLTGDRIVAEGSVVIWYEGARLTASRVSYDRSSGQLVIEGPLTLSQGEDMVLFASSAELSEDLREGIARSARLVLDERLQIAAAQVDRVDGRYTRARQVIASSCEVCAARPVPLWSIRADEVIHDQDEGQIYYRNAQFRILDLPVLWMPSLRTPDPTNTRATGFLAPRLEVDSTIGTALRLPYFIEMGDHADLTLTPFVGPQTTTLEYRYRQRFASGRIEAEGALSRDTLLPGGTRAWIFADGQFDIGRDYRLSFDIEQVSDPAYLYDYDYSSKDRLDSAISVQRVRRDELIHGEITQYETLRASEIPIAGQLAFLTGDVLYERRFQPGGLAGELLGGDMSYSFSAQGHARGSEADGAGRDVARAGAALDWRRDWYLSSGLVMTGLGEISADSWWIWQDSAYAPQVGRLTAAGGVTLAYPMARQRGSAVETLTPMAQLAWAGALGGDVPNEDSQMVEFDEANLFDLSRFAGEDRFESGLRANLGMLYTREALRGWSYSLAGGKVFHFDGSNDFSAASGLDGTASDWLLAGRVEFGERLLAQSRTLVADDWSVTKAETLLAWNGRRMDVATGYYYVIADPEERRTLPIHELILDTSYDITPQWTLGADGRYNFADRQITRAGLSVGFENECVEVDLSVTRRFTSASNVTPSTNFGFGVTLSGWGGSTGSGTRHCAQPQG